jgi:5-methylcytosine-specific restriction protein A
MLLPFAPGVGREYTLAQTARVCFGAPANCPHLDTGHTSMSLTNIKSRQSILAAVEEYNRLGHDAFLAKYGFLDARSYFLILNGKKYPSKAIVGAAHGYEHPAEGPLKAQDFRSGKDTVRRKLEALGFEVQVLGLGAEPTFDRNRIYRRSKIHALLGGQRNGGISTPLESKYILLFTGAAGKAAGDFDRWTDDGIFLYTGEGQQGNMEFNKGNAAIRNHLANGRELLLFSYVRAGYVRFVDQMICTGYHFDNRPNGTGPSRSVIVFELTPVDAFGKSESAETNSEDQPEEASLEALRARAIASSAAGQTPSERRAAFYDRGRAIRLYVQKRANGKCEGCGMSAPFTTASGKPYLEVHHIRRPSDSGPDHPQWVVAVCANCHRRAHYAADSIDFNLELERAAYSKESPLL